MKKYDKPVVHILEDLSEGVYAASGDSCYVSTSIITQIPQEGRGTYCIQVNASHNASHHSKGQILTLIFDRPVSYSSSKGTLLSGDNTNVLRIQYQYHNNNVENIGLGNVYVIASEGLSAPMAELSCDSVLDGDCPGC